MNTPVRKLSVLVAALFASLLVSTTLIQYVFAADLNARPDNRRTLLSTYARERGEILVGQTPVARSVPSDDQYKFQREYGAGPLYAHVTGSYSFYGAQGGLERAENALLSGSSDKLFYRRVSDLFTGRRPQGATLETTLDATVQKAAEDGLEGIRGAAVALDPKTGAILAMVSHPTFDPNALATHDLTALERRYAELNGDPAKPLVNRSINGDLYPPGSVFKVVTAAAALSTG
ncbi:MAG TPA: penicillin-binding transpeptidase domain-containing protein, partial [Ornithinibacter sp.]|nr:penicillin-binding transpeptidase domain-containing protein [Ornithinibacter sp.]